MDSLKHLYVVIFCLHKQQQSCKAEQGLEFLRLEAQKEKVSGTQIMGRSAHLHLMLSSVTTAKFKINVVASTSTATTWHNK
ncbi:hypothetical protein YC2023_025045 [Brassica napus]